MDYFAVAFGVLLLAAFLFMLYWIMRRMYAHNTAATQAREGGSNQRSGTLEYNTV